MFEFFIIVSVLFLILQNYFNVRDLRKLREMNNCLQLQINELKGGETE